MSKMLKVFLALALTGSSYAVLHAEEADQAPQANAQEDQAITQQNNADQPSVKLEDETAKLSYTLGLQIGSNIGMNFQRGGIDIKPDALTQGVYDALTNAKPRLSQEEIQQVMQSFQVKMQAKQAEAKKQFDKMSEENKKAGDAYRAENAKKEGVTVTDSGLQYKVIKEGEGASPKSGDTVTVHYTGTFVDGTEFDSSKNRGPATFPVDGVVPGFSEALKMMKVGSEWQVVIPPELGYGDQPGGQMPPNKTLIFDLKLLGINQDQDQNQDQPAGE